MSGRRIDRRSCTRVSTAGDILWQSGLDAGNCNVVDISPCGAAIEVPERHAFQIGPTVALNIESKGVPDWPLGDSAEVVHKLPRADGTCRIGVKFPSGGTDRAHRRDSTKGPPG